MRSVHDLFCQRFCVWGNRGHCCSKGYPPQPSPHHSLSQRVDESHQDWSPSVRGIPPRRHASPGIQNQGEPEMGCVPRGCLDCTLPSQGHPPSPDGDATNMPNPSSHSNPRGIPNTAMKNQVVPFEPKPSTLKISCSCILLRSTYRWIYWKRFPYQVSCVNH